MAKVKVPADILKEVKLDYEYGEGPGLGRFIEFHKDLAEKRLAQLVNDLDAKVISTEVKGDGWMTGMKVLHVVLELTPSQTVLLQWHPDNQEFFVESTSGASFPFKMAFDKSGLKNVSPNKRNLDFRV